MANLGGDVDHAGLNHFVRPLESDPLHEPVAGFSADVAMVLHLSSVLLHKRVFYEGKLALLNLVDQHLVPPLFCLADANINHVSARLVVSTAQLLYQRELKVTHLCKLLLLRHLLDISRLE